MTTLTASSAMPISDPESVAPFPALPLARVVGCEYRGRQRWLTVETSQGDSGTLRRLAQAIHDLLPSDCAVLRPSRDTAQILACLQVLAFAPGRFRWVLADLAASSVLADLGPANPLLPARRS